MTFCARAGVSVHTGQGPTCLGTFVCDRQPTTQASINLLVRGKGKELSNGNTKLSQGDKQQRADASRQ
ncbi:hypothetical protein MCOR02_000400 [Pyricularia oryzae]|uniref:Uncharacterized protein n=2 Tax=Pyricularia TaxID=48558 RepID=A0ABQ8NAK5_PYRGI|nr:hypothetical protein MCOR02_000400 [Pyricularia oryzae]KAI6294007.1 hypothetical protein MCOR33_008767 [Pyricularia grisea]KAI6261454.1 hypothetical protein MCOR19_002264 [Pyricularia oryzae]KAI6329695.1 hypothetical protein MCOR30_005446 [Pyricularia oryzae]KAI6348223.1 hypothetical protein MCOR28_001808 [Pyricularia oryzae]